ncbi:hypothetical protein V6Z11_D05G191800 [Gossypium hirsutum]
MSLIIEMENKFCSCHTSFLLNTLICTSFIGNKHVKRGKRNYHYKVLRSHNNADASPRFISSIHVLMMILVHAYANVNNRMANINRPLNLQVLDLKHIYGHIPLCNNLKFSNKLELLKD